MTKCINKLIKVEQKIYKFEDEMFKSWEEVEQLFEFKDKLDYFDYMTSTKKFAKLMHKKNVLETYIYSNNKVENMPEKTHTGVNMKDYINKKIVPIPIVCDPLEVEFTITKKYSMDSLKLAVFSPCSGTQFNLETKCGKGIS
jgi:hypothetical protein